MAEKQTFDVVLEKHENMEATGITIPFDVEKVFGAKRVPVKVWINGAEHRSTGQVRRPRRHRSTSQLHSDSYGESIESSSRNER